MARPRAPLRVGRGHAPALWVPGLDGVTLQPFGFPDSLRFCEKVTKSRMLDFVAFSGPEAPTRGPWELSESQQSGPVATTLTFFKTVGPFSDRVQLALDVKRSSYETVPVATTRRQLRREYRSIGPLYRFPAIEQGGRRLLGASAIVLRGDGSSAGTHPLLPENRARVEAWVQVVDQGLWVPRRR